MMNGPKERDERKKKEGRMKRDGEEKEQDGEEKIMKCCCARLALQ